MFSKPKKLPEDMTDAEMHTRLTAMKDRIKWINKYVPRIAAAVGGSGAVLAAAGWLFLGAITGPAAPGIFLSVTVGGAAIGLAFGGAAKSSCENEIWMLSEENKDRLARAEIAAARAKVKNTPAPKSTLDLRAEFDAAISEMDKCTQRAIAVSRPLKIGAKRPDASA